MILEANGVGALTEDLGVVNLFKSVFSYSSKNDVENAKSKYSKSIATAEKELAARGVDVGKVKNLAEQKAKKLIVFIRSENLSEATFDKASELASEVGKSFFDVFASLYKDLENEQSIPLGIAAFVIIYAVNTLALTILTVFVGYNYALFSVIVFIAPLVEESARRVLIKSGEGLGSFTVAINVFEFINHGSRLIQMGASIGVAITIRAVVALFHHTMSTLQKWGYLKDLNSGVPKEDAGQFEYALAILFHAIHNYAAPYFWKIVFPGTFGEATLIGNEAFFV